MRFLPMPAWHANRTQPIDERDAVEYLVRTPATPAAAGRSLDIAGSDVLRYGEMIEQIAELMGVGRTSIPLGLSQTPAASAVVARIVGQPLELVRPLMESLGHELLPREEPSRPRSTASARGPSAEPWSTPCASGKPASRWRRDESRALHPDQRFARRRSTRW